MSRLKKIWYSIIYKKCPLNRMGFCTGTRYDRMEWRGKTCVEQAREIGGCLWYRNIALKTQAKTTSSSPSQKQYMIATRPENTTAPQRASK